MTDKYTQRDFYNEVIATEGVSDKAKAFAEDAIAKMDARNEKRKTTQSPTQKANEATKEAIVEYLTNNGQKSAAEVATALELSSTSKASSLLSQLCAAERVKSVEVRVTGKGKHKAYFVG